MIKCTTCKKYLYHRLREGFCATCKKEREYIHKKRAKYMHYYERLLSDGWGSDHRSPFVWYNVMVVKSLSKYKKELDTWFSRWIRIRDKGVCYTCGLKKHWKEMQCGHFVPRQYLSVRFDKINCHCQCYACNMLYNGQPSRYAQRLEQDYGKGTVDMLEAKRHETTKLDWVWYEEKIAYYKSLVEQNENL